jgi:hypothetical protein
MSEVTDIIIEDPEPEDGFSLLDIIDNQMYVIANIVDLDTSAYEKMEEDRIKALSLAFRVIQKIQVKLLKTI